MISEGSCDTEDWSNDAENTALFLKDIKTVILNHTILLYFWTNKCRLGELKSIKNLTDPKPLKIV